MFSPPANLTKLLPLLLMLLGNAVAHSIFMIGFPLMGRSIGLSELQTGALLSISAFSMMMVTPFWGRYIDRAGRTKPILFGIIVTACFLIATGLLFEYQHNENALNLFAVYLIVFSLRLLQSLGVAGVMPGAQAYIADSTTSQERLSGMGLLGAAFGIGSILGGYLVMNAGIEHFSVTLMILGAFMLLTIVGYRWLPEISAVQVKPMTSLPKPTLPLQHVLPFALITFCVLLIYGLLQQTVGLRLQDQLNYTMVEAMKGSGALLMTSMICMTIGQLILSFIRVSYPYKLLIFGLLLGTLCLYILGLADSFKPMLFAMVGLGFSMSMIIPANLTLLSQKAGQENQAYAASINTIGKGLGWAAGPLLGGILYQFTPVMPVWTSIGLMLVAASVALYISRSSQTQLRPV